MMKLYDNGDFLLHNLGSRAIYVDGKSVIKGDRVQLQNNSVIEIGLIILHFTRNENYKKPFLPANINQQQQPMIKQQQSNSAKGPMSPKSSLMQAQSLLSIQLQQKTQK